MSTGKYPPAEPGALGIEPLKAAEFGAAGAARDGGLADSAVRSFHLATRPYALPVGTGMKPTDFALMVHPYNALWPIDEASSRVLGGSRLDASSVGRLQETSNCYCHPGRAGGSPGYASEYGACWRLRTSALGGAHRSRQRRRPPRLATRDRGTQHAHDHSRTVPLPIIPH